MVNIHTVVVKCVRKVPELFPNSATFRWVSWVPSAGALTTVPHTLLLPVEQQLAAKQLE